MIKKQSLFLLFFCLYIGQLLINEIIILVFLVTSEYDQKDDGRDVHFDLVYKP